MKKPALLSIYGAAWRLARPWLKRHKRLSIHFAERLVPQAWPQNLLPAICPPEPAAGAHPPFRLWLHAASGGEAYLARELLRELAPRLPRLAVLCTSMTQQGVEVLAKVRQEFSNEHCFIAVNYFPLDEPGLMRRAVRQVFGPPSGQAQRAPCAVVLLETEIWPGLLWACRNYGLQSYIVNGRMTPASFKAYSRMKGTLRSMAPDAVLATSQADAERFSAIFDEPGAAWRVALMPNIKFDRALPVEAGRVNALRALLGSKTLDSPASANSPDSADAPQIILLASVREEEEAELLPVIRELRKRCPEACIIVAPRHPHRSEAWQGYLADISASFQQRSKGIERLGSGELVLWDTFGELFDLYGLAEAVFVGGSLAPLGGQNFLEPMSFGLRPVIGPSWSNFYWVGREPFELGLVRQVKNGTELVAELLAQLVAPISKEQTREIFSAYLAKHQGGSKMAANFLIKRLGVE